jgi:CHAT domain-containing protein
LDQLPEARGERKSGVRKTPSMRYRRAAWTFAAVTFTTALIVGGMWRRQAASHIESLVAVAPGDFRLIEPRLSGGFPWAPLPGDERGVDSPRVASRYVMLGAAGHVLERTQDRTGVDAQHAAAVANLLTGDVDRARKILSQAAGSVSDASIWSDLAAAHYVAATRRDLPEYLEDALAAADEALRIDSRHEEALFNRALILERLHLRTAAAEAWRNCIDAQPEGPWANEARQRLLVMTKREPTFDSSRDREYARLERGDTAAAGTLLELDAGKTRYFIQTTVLGDWGDAWLRGDPAAAARHLTAARTVGAALQAFNGDAIVADTVAAIDRADPSLVPVLARGHAAFRNARRMYEEERRRADAERILIDAARDLATGGSPMADDARVYLAVAVLYQGRGGEAETILRQLSESVPQRYAALRAYILWQQAVCVMARAEWGRAIELLTQAIDAYDNLRETLNTAFLRNIIAQAYASTGDRSRAARFRLLALQELGRSRTRRLQHLVGGVVYDAIQRKDFRIAASFLKLQAHIARDVSDQELHVDALMSRAFVSSRLGHHAAAEADLKEAGAVVASVADSALREKLETDRIAVAALVSGEPAAAVQLLTQALRFHERKGWRMLMPNLYLRRGQMHLLLEEPERAAADFESGIAELETHRASLPSGEARWGMLDSAEDLFDEAIEAALEREPALAFDYAERERARSLSDTLPNAAARFDIAKLPPDAIVIEYAVLPRKLVLFAVDDRGYRVAQKAIVLEEVVSLLGQLNDAFRSGTSAQRKALARRVHELLIGPVRESLARYRTVVFVPDAATSSVPFAALTDSATGRALMEDHVVSVAPSARMYLQVRERHSGTAPRDILIVDNPRNDDADSLGSASAEARAIRSLYPAGGRRLSGAEATRRAVLESLPESSVVHFASHNAATADSAALLLASTAGDSDRLEAAAIAPLRLQRTEVVVLAACGSARGPVRTAEGPLSVAYAFLQAGVPSVVATLWPIPDRESSRFFPRLHRHLANGIPAAEALRLAQLEAMRESPDDEPPIWAAVQAIGY